MKAKELAAKLMEHPELDVVLSQDEEGNGYKPLAATDVAKFDAGEVYSLEDMHAPKRSRIVFVLWP